MTAEQTELKQLLESRFPIVIVETAEERRFLQMIESVATLSETPLFTWSLVQGLRRYPRGDAVLETRELAKALWHLLKSPQNGYFVFLDPQAFLDHPEIIRLIREIGFDYTRTQQTMVFVGSTLGLAADLLRMSATFRMAPMTPDDVRKLCKEEMELYASRNDGHAVRNEAGAYELIVQHLVGLSRDDARRLVRQAIERDGCITMEDVAGVLRHKHESLGRGGALQLVTELESFERVGGQARLKKWLELRRGAFLGTQGAQGLDVPKGVLLLGVQGGGKSLAAKAVAGSWRVPLLRLDFGAMYDKFHGETERNMRAALETAAAMSPCVLWLDEIEKGLATGDASGDSGVSRRVLATLLTWMSERRNRVFLIATANNIEALPPELLRKGRFDEIFFVDLPGAQVRAEIFRIHLDKRGHAAAQFDLAGLAAASQSFSGAEIEQAIVAASYSAFADKVALGGQHVLQELRSTRPLAVLRAEEVAALRQWADGRTVPAD
jgi:ATPase family associated with various cellular activities (AAA)